MASYCPVCAFCGDPMEERTGTYAYDFQGRRVTVQGVEFCECPQCGRQATHAEQNARNAERISHANLEIIAARWSFEPPEPPDRAS